jgi:hypothetical protein
VIPYQPYREGEPRQEGHALSAMLAGRDLYGQNPQDQVRNVQSQTGKKDDGSLLWHIMRMMQNRTP